LPFSFFRWLFAPLKYPYPYPAGYFFRASYFPFNRSCSPRSVCFVLYFSSNGTEHLSLVLRPLRYDLSIVGSREAFFCDLTVVVAQFASPFPWERYGAAPRRLPGATALSMVRFLPLREVKLAWGHLQMTIELPPPVTPKAHSPFSGGTCFCLPF